MKAKIYNAKEIAEYNATHEMHPKILAAQKKEAVSPSKRRTLLGPKRNKAGDAAEQKMEMLMLHGENQ